MGKISGQEVGRRVVVPRGGGLSLGHLYCLGSDVFLTLPALGADLFQGKGNFLSFLDLLVGQLKVFYPIRMGDGAIFFFFVRKEKKRGGNVSQSKLPFL